MTIEGKMMAYYGKPDALKSFIAGFENADNPTNQMQVLLAKLYLENKDYERAYKLYQALDKAQGKEGTELLNFGLQLMQAGQSGLAVDVFEYILARYPKTTTANIVKLNLGKSLEADADKKAEIKKEQWKPLTVKGNAEFSEYDRAINAYKELIRTYPHAEPSVEGIFRIGKINSDAGFTDSAKLCFKAVIKNYSVSKFAQLSSFELSDIYIRENKLDSAKALLERILTLPYSSQQDKNNARYQLAAISFYTGDFEQARTHYDLILQQPDDDFTNDALELSTLLNTTMNDSALVAKFAEILLKIAQGEFQGLDAQLATVCSAKNQFYVKSLAEEKRIELRIALNDYGEAIALINSVVKEKSNIFEDRLYYCLARIYQFGLKDSVQAGRTYERFLEAYPNSLFSEKVRDAIKEMQKNL
jgi:tetratricopeptide (TPR) repeat protein